MASSAAARRAALEAAAAAAAAASAAAAVAGSARALRGGGGGEGRDRRLPSRSLSKLRSRLLLLRLLPLRSGLRVRLLLRLRYRLVGEDDLERRRREGIGLAIETKNKEEMKKVLPFLLLSKQNFGFSSLFRGRRPKENVISFCVRAVLFV